MNRFRRLLAGALCASLVFSSALRSEMISTEQLLAQQRAADLGTVRDFLARDQVRAELEYWGVAPEAAGERVAALTDAELQLLAGRIESQPAGGILGVIGVVFVVLIVLELVGAIDLFKKI